MYWAVNMLFVLLTLTVWLNFGPSGFQSLQFLHFHVGIFHSVDSAQPGRLVGLCWGVIAANFALSGHYWTGSRQLLSDAFYFSLIQQIWMVGKLVSNFLILLFSLKTYFYVLNEENIKCWSLNQSLFSTNLLSALIRRLVLPCLHPPSLGKMLTMHVCEG